MSSGYTRQSSASIQAGLTITSSSFNNEYNAIQTAFDNSSGHDHNQVTTGTGAPIGVSALTGLSANGIVVRGTSAYINRTLTGTANRVTVTNGDGAAGNPTITLTDTAVTPASYTLASITVSQDGRITAASSGSGAAPTLPRGYLAGLNVTFNSTTVFNVSAGVCRSTDNTVDMSLGSAFTKTLGSAWVVGTGNGALDTGAIADNWYHIFTIYNAGATDILASLSATAPTLPAGWTNPRRIFSLFRSGGAISKFFHQSGLVIWNTPTQTSPITTALGGTTPTLNTLIGLPTGIRTFGQGIVNMSSTAVNGYCTVYSGDITASASSPGNNGNDMTSSNNLASGNASFPFSNLLTNLSGQLGFISNNVAGNSVGAVYIGGYFDHRGRDD